MADEVNTEFMPRGESGTRQTIDKMHRLVALGKLDPTLHKIASWIRIRVPADRRGTSRNLADAIFWFARRHGIFQQDPHQVERIEHPIEAMRPVIQARRAGTYRGPGLFVGDCDLFTIYIATLGGLLGFPYRFETVKLDPSRPDEYSHIYPALQVGGKWIAYDATRQNAAPNVRPNVPPALFASWDEGEIEKVVGMSGMNGFGDIESEEQQPEGDEFAEDYVGYGIPKSFDNGQHFGEIPEVCPGLMDQSVPFAPALPAADVEQDFAPLQKVEHPDPRIGAVDIEGRYLPRPIYQDQPKSERYQVSHPYDKSYPFQHQVLAAEEQKHGLVPGDVLVPPSQEGYNLMYASGLGETREELEGLMRDHLRYVQLAQAEGNTTAAAAHQAEADKIAAQLAALEDAGGSVMDSIESVLSDVIKMTPGISEAYIQSIRDKYKKQILEAQAKVAQAEADRARAQVSLVGGVSMGTPWYQNPLIIIGGLVLLVGGVLLMTGAGGGSSRRPLYKRRSRHGRG